MIAEYGRAVTRHAPKGDNLGLLWLVYPLAVLADERTYAGAFRQAFSIQNTVRERLAGHHEKHKDSNCDEVVSVFHLMPLVWATRIQCSKQGRVFR